jgi:hypothetical protein
VISPKRVKREPIYIIGTPCWVDESIIIIITVIIIIITVQLRQLLAQKVMLIGESTLANRDIGRQRICICRIQNKNDTGSLNNGWLYAADAVPGQWNEVQTVYTFSTLARCAEATLVKDKYLFFGIR